MEGDSSNPKPTIRHEWYQTESYVVVTILIRNVKHEEINVTYTESKLTVEIAVPSEEKYNLTLNLAHKIVPEKCSYKIMTTKVEVKLIKAEGIQWHTLEGDPEQIGPKIIPMDSSVSSGPPPYPTSNPLHRDWDAIEKDLLKELAKEKPNGEEGVNQLFQKIYGEGSDEVKKAMNKSYLESGGTVLSTNWNEIRKEKVQVKPPGGMEWKEWTQ